jgi:hypothetical protein
MEEITLLRIYETNKSVGYSAPIIVEDHTIDVLMRTIAVLEYLKVKLVKQLDKEFLDE